MRLYFIQELFQGAYVTGVQLIQPLKDLGLLIICWLLPQVP